MTPIIVDGYNVLGATPDGWWRDRPGAVRRLLSRLQCHRRATGDEIVLVLDAPQPDLPEGEHDGVIVEHARRRGRNAADDRIRDLLAERADGTGAAAAGDVEVVTSDRALAESAAERGATVSGARAFLRRLEATGC